MEMSEVFGDPEAREIGESVAHFLTSRLHRSFESDEEVCFSYTPNDKSWIYNSSALIGVLLARIGRLLDNHTYLSLARRGHGFSGKGPDRNRRMVLRATSAATLDRQLPHLLQRLRPARLPAHHRGLNL